ncbi:alpha/beta-hydrolase, partial [Cylindrobasidium torrendii FP15055 ss-10]
MFPVWILAVLSQTCYGSPTKRDIVSEVTVKLDDAMVTGVSNATTLVDSFLGIPFGKPPVGNLRFSLPQAVDAYTGAVNATTYGPACPQQLAKVPTLPDVPGLEYVQAVFDAATSSSLADDEDCLSINVLRPSGVNDTSNLPVVAWIYGGGFQEGSTAATDGSGIVSRSIQLGEPVIYVSMNYRVSAFGFLAGQEVKDAGVGNLGLHDQRLALKWIQKYILSFGGDPNKVTIWGESAGAISVSLHMVMKDGDNEGLFRAAFMNSGSPGSMSDITAGQADYDTLVDKTGCSSEADTLACLRAVDYDTLKAAVDESPFIFDYQALSLPWRPRVDGVLFSDEPQTLVTAGKVSAVPIVNGDCDDEGTLFSFSQLNVTTDDEFRTYVGEIYFKDKASDKDLDAVMESYPSELTAGSPFDTGDKNALTPQFKRLAAFQGDAVFQAPRRFFLRALEGNSNSDIWTFAHKTMKSTPYLGAFHSSDLLDAYGGGPLAEYVIHFVNNLDPNGGNSPAWPRWTSAGAQMLAFSDTGVTVIKDTYRQEAMEKINAIMAK